MKIRSKFKDRKKGAALVVTLALVVLITTMLLAFFVNSTLNGQLEVSSTARMETSILGQSALELVVADLRKEIMAGSILQNNVMLPVPATNGTNVSYISMQPYRVLSDTNVMTNSLFDSLVKQSTPREGMFPTTNDVYSHNGSAPTITAGMVSGNSTLTPSRNNRRLSLERWSFPRLVPTTNGAANGFTNDVQAPYWIYMDKNGLTTTANTNVVGRFAFNVYNVGGLLNINIAGSPSTLGDLERSAIKGTPIGAVLTNTIIPGMTNAAGFIQWRDSYSSALPPGTYTNKVLSDTNGFRQPITDDVVNPTFFDNRFVSRQDLIRYTLLNGTNMSTNALPYLTTFSMELNRPSWTPTINAATGYRYRDDATNTASTNRDLRTAVKPDGTTLLLPTRFPLSAIKLVPVSGEGDVAADAMATYFGLRWNSGEKCWNYLVPASDGSIATLGQVPANRSPNFFELLKAVILSGSLGKTSGNGLSAVDNYDKLTDQQIIQIGCNIIDQYRADDIPIRVKLGTDSTYGIVAGSVDAPYINKLIHVFFRPAPGVTTGLGIQDAQSSIVGAWFVPEFWRPYRRSAYGPAPSDQTIKFQATKGKTTLHVYSSSFNVGGTVDFANQSIQFVAATNHYRDTPRPIPSTVTPTSIAPTGIIQDTRAQSVSKGFGALYGINVGYNDRVKPPASPTPTPESLGYLKTYPNSRAMVPGTITRLDLFPADDMEFTAQVLGPDGLVQYDFIRNMKSGRLTDVRQGCYPNGGPDNPDFVNHYISAPSYGVTAAGIARIEDKSFNLSLTWAAPLASMFRSDPRTDRFGMSYALAAQMGVIKGLNNPATFNYADPLTYPKTTGTGGTDPNAYNPANGGMRTSGVVAGGQFSASGWFNNAGIAASWTTDVTMNKTIRGVYPGALTDNKPGGSAGSLYYTDNDGVQRRAMGAYTTYYMNEAARLPIMLNRPFFSVGELGYVHRGEPWKNLDFFTAQSADAGLLDVFSATEQGDVVEGKVDINSAPWQVLASYINGTVSDEGVNVNNLVSDADAAAIAKKIRAEVKNANFVNKADLVTRFGDALATRPSADGDKMKQEAFIRAFADTAQTRTWNLMIDLVAQKGRLADSSNLGSFIVEGERRYWLHIAIDRYTGQIIGQKLEPVYE